MQNKYIIIEILGQVTPFLFPETLSHSNVAYSIGLGSKPISAGFWTVRPNEDGNGVRYEVYGESFTLNLKSRKEDSEILNRFFNLYWYGAGALTVL